MSEYRTSVGIESLLEAMSHAELVALQGALWLATAEKYRGNPEVRRRIGVCFAAVQRMVAEDVAAARALVIEAAGSARVDLVSLGGTAGEGKEGKPECPNGQN